MTLKVLVKTYFPIFFRHFVAHFVSHCRVSCSDLAYERILSSQIYVELIWKGMRRNRARKCQKFHLPSDCGDLKTAFCFTNVIFKDRTTKVRIFLDIISNGDKRTVRQFRGEKFSCAFEARSPCRGSSADQRSQFRFGPLIQRLLSVIHYAFNEVGPATRNDIAPVWIYLQHVPVSRISVFIFFPPFLSFASPRTSNGKKAQDIRQFFFEFFLFSFKRTPRDPLLQNVSRVIQYHF